MKDSLLRTHTIPMVELEEEIQLCCDKNVASGDVAGFGELVPTFRRWGEKNSEIYIFETFYFGAEWVSQTQGVLEEHANSVFILLAFKRDWELRCWWWHKVDKYLFIRSCLIEKVLWVHCVLFLVILNIWQSNRALWNTSRFCWLQM